MTDAMEDIALKDLGTVDHPELNLQELRDIASISMRRSV
jgi:hypothetical protein